MKKNKIFGLALLALGNAFAADVSLNRSDFKETKIFSNGGGGVSDCAINSKKEVFVVIEAANAVVLNTIDSIVVNNALFQDHSSFTLSDDTLFVGNRSGYVIKSYNGKIDSLPRIPNSDIVTALAQSPSGVLFATTTLGTFSYSSGVWTKEGLTGNSGKDLQFSGDTLWSAGNGVLRFLDGQWTQMGEYSTNQINSDREGGMIGSYVTGGLELGSFSGNYTRKSFTEDISTTYTDANGLLWLGNNDNDGIRIYDPAQDKIVASVDSLMGAQSEDGIGMVRFMEDVDGGLWLCGEAWTWEYTGEAHKKIGGTSSVGTSSSMGSSSSDGIDPVIINNHKLGLVDQGDFWSVVGFDSQNVWSATASILFVDGTQKSLGQFSVKNGELMISKPELSSGKAWLQIESGNKNYIFGIK